MISPGVSGYRHERSPMTTAAELETHPGAARAARRSPGKLLELFGADARSLALFRIGLGGSLLVDLLTRATDFEAHYTDAGILPRSLLLPFSRLTLPLHRLSGSASIEALLFLVAGLAAAALMVGYRTRTVTVISWLMLQSLHERNRLILDGGDPLLRIMLFWSMFLPLGARWSLDRRWIQAAPGPDDAPDRQLSSFGTAAFLLQIASMYFFTGLLKLEFPVWRAGTALRYALLAYHMTTPLGTSLLQYPRLLSVLGTSVLAFEIFGPFLLFSPVRTGPLRTLATFGFVLMQLGIAACMTIGNFQPSAILLVVPLLPAWFWDRLLPRLGLFRLSSAHRGGEDSAAKARRTSRAARALDITAGVLGVYIFLCNVGTLFVRHELPGRPERLAYFLGIDQRWDMFGGPRRPTGWTVIPAKLANGDLVDLLTGRQVSWDKPEVPADIYRSWRFRRYTTWYIWTPRGERYRAAYADYLCRTWNQEHPEDKRIVSLEIVWMRQISAVDFTLRPEERVSVYQGNCATEAP
jgi:hypothetical protein